MKHLKLFATLCCAAVLFAACSTTTGTENGHEYVDLGLPSGTKWATCNVGANSPEAYGDYFAWGETTTKSYYAWSTYKWCNGGSDKLTKYNTKSNEGIVDNKTTLTLADDAARANWGGKWRTPTYAEWIELEENCTWTWTSDYQDTGIAGRIVTGPNGNSIFLPAAGARNDDRLGGTGNGGEYWSSSLGTAYPSSAWYVLFLSGDVYRYSFYRYLGLSVRPVFK